MWDLLVMLLLGQAHGSPIPHHLGYLHNALCALAPPDYQCGHEQRDRNGERNERAEDAVGRVPQGPARDGALAEVLMVDSDEEPIHFRIGPETANLLCHVPGAVRELPIAPVDTKRGYQETQLGLRLLQPEAMQSFLSFQKFRPQGRVLALPGEDPASRG